MEKTMIKGRRKVKGQMPLFYRRKKIRQKEKQIKKRNITSNLERSLTANLNTLQQMTGNSPDIQIKKLTVGQGQGKGKKVAIINVDGIVDADMLNHYVIEPIQMQKLLLGGSSQQISEMLEESLWLGGIETVEAWDSAFEKLMDGFTLIFVDGEKSAIAISTSGGEKRQIDEPQSQVSVRGPRDGFTESIQTNLALVRRRIRNPDLWTETMKIGRQTKTSVTIMYLNGIAKEEIVEEVRARLKKIDIDSILESGYIEQLIEDKTMTTFPTMYHTERPDAVAGNILEGRIAIFIDGTPFVLLAPAVFIQFFQAVEDYYARFDIATALRFLRIITFFISIIAPSVYIAGTTFHQEMIPTALLIVIASQRESVPFPAFVEAIIMEVTFEILREAGVRLPRPVGSAISIVGALVIGQAAVQAGIVSPAMVIIVSITAIANFTTPSFAMAISTRLIRFVFMILAATFGFYGVVLGIIFLVIHLCSLRSFGVPYLTPSAPFFAGNIGDTLIRAPLWKTREKANLIMEDKETAHGMNTQRPKPPASRAIKNKNVPEEDGNGS